MHSEVIERECERLRKIASNYRNRIISGKNKLDYWSPQYELKEQNKKMKIQRDFESNRQNKLLHQRSKMTYLTAISLGCDESMYQLGLIYEEYESNIKAAMVYYFMALENGNINALNQIKLLLRNIFYQSDIPQDHYCSHIFSLIKPIIIGQRITNPKEIAYQYQLAYFHLKKGVNNYYLNNLYNYYHEQIEITSDDDKIPLVFKCIIFGCCSCLNRVCYSNLNVIKAVSYLMNNLKYVTFARISIITHLENMIEIKFPILSKPLYYDKYNESKSSKILDFLDDLKEDKMPAYYNLKVLFGKKWSYDSINSFLISSIQEMRNKLLHINQLNYHLHSQINYLNESLTIRIRDYINNVFDQYMKINLNNDVLSYMINLLHKFHQDNCILSIDEFLSQHISIIIYTILANNLYFTSEIIEKIETYFSCLPGGEEYQKVLNKFNLTNNIGY